MWILDSYLQQAWWAMDHHFSNQPIFYRVPDAPRGINVFWIAAFKHLLLFSPCLFIPFLINWGLWNHFLEGSLQRLFKNNGGNYKNVKSRRRWGRFESELAYLSSLHWILLFWRLRYGRESLSFLIFSSFRISLHCCPFWWSLVDSVNLKKHKCFLGFFGRTVRWSKSWNQKYFLSRQPSSPRLGTPNSAIFDLSLKSGLSNLIYLELRARILDQVKLTIWWKGNSNEKVGNLWEMRGRNWDLK